MQRLWMLSLAMLGMGTSVAWGQEAPQGPHGPWAPQVRQHGKPNKITKINGEAFQDRIPDKVFIVEGGWNLDKNEALNNALEKAREQLQTYLREQKRSMEWIPKPTFVRDRLLADLRRSEVELRKKELVELGKKEFAGDDSKVDLEEFLIGERIRAVEETREIDEQGKDKPRRVWLKVALNADTWKQIQKENQLVVDQKRLRITRARMEFLIKLLACVVALLATVCGYIRLDEWSKGYYTKWLRLAALGCIGALAAVLWLVVAK
jgi:hypothetical protein